MSNQDLDRFAAAHPDEDLSAMLLPSERSIRPDHSQEHQFLVAELGGEPAHDKESLFGPLLASRRGGVHERLVEVLQRGHF